MSTEDRANGATLLEVKNLRVHFPIIGGFLRTVKGYVRAVDDVSFHLLEGETLGLVGESGCGKTTTGRAILRAVEATDGEILFTMRDGQTVPVRSADDDVMKVLRQENPDHVPGPVHLAQSTHDYIRHRGRPITRFNHLAGGKELEDRVSEMLRLVGLAPEFMRRYPHAFSGGQRQRIGIARALILNPRLVVADEPVSALDVSVQAQILNLMQDLQDEFKLTYLFVSHDLSVVQYISHRVAVMYVGKLVEVAPTEELFTQPKHPYTQALLGSIPVPDPTVRSGMLAMEGEVADAAAPPSGCYFHPRCPYAQDICRTTEPPLHQVKGEHYSACHFAEELELAGVPA